VNERIIAKKEDMTTLSQPVKMTIVDDDDDDKTMELLPDHPTRIATLNDQVLASAWKATEEAFDSKRIDENDNNNSKNGSLHRKIAAIQAEIEAVQRERIQIQTETQLQRQRHEFWMGRMFAKLSSVWEIEYRKVTDGAWESFRRTRTPGMLLARSSVSVESTAAADRPYIVTKASEDEARVPIGTTQSLFPNTKSGTSERIQNIWPCDFAGKPLKDGMGVKTTYLVPPATERGHEQWIDIAAAVLGLPPDASIDIKLKGLRGSKIITKSQQKRLHNYDTGVVHMITNKVLMKRQVWDGINPKLLLIPCLTMDQAKAWNGEAYCAIALAGLPKGGQVLPYTCEESSVYRDVGLAEEESYPTHRFASANQISLA